MVAKSSSTLWQSRQLSPSAPLRTGFRCFEPKSLAALTYRASETQNSPPETGRGTPALTPKTAGRETDIRGSPTLSARLGPKSARRRNINTISEWLVGEVGLEPTKAKPADLQSAPFAARDTPPDPSAPTNAHSPRSESRGRKGPGEPGPDRGSLILRPALSCQLESVEPAARAAAGLSLPAKSRYGMRTPPQFPAAGEDFDPQEKPTAARFRASRNA